MIKKERLRHGLVVAGAVAAALGGGVGAAQAAGAAAPATALAQETSGAAHRPAGDELPELGTPVAASGLTSGMGSVTEGNPVLIPPFDGFLTALPIPIPNPADGLGALAGGGGKK